MKIIAKASALLLYEKEIEVADGLSEDEINDFAMRHALDTPYDEWTTKNLESSYEVCNGSVCRYFKLSEYSFHVNPEERLFLHPISGGEWWEPIHIQPPKNGNGWDDFNHFKASMEEADYTVTLHTNIRAHGTCDIPTDQIIVCTAQDAYETIWFGIAVVPWQECHDVHIDNE